MSSWIMSLTVAQRTGVVYGAVLAAWLFGLELPARFGWLPIDTLSGDVRHAIRWWHPVGVMVAVFFVTLFGHFDKGWSVWWLILVGATITTCVVVHTVLP